jgi:restriction endonuclease S subunit
MHPKFALLRKTILPDEMTMPLRKFCARPVTRGLQPEYGDSDILAVKTGTLRNGYLDFTELQTVPEAFYEKVQRRAGLKRNDILIACTGVGSLGKVDLYDRDDPAVADGHVAIFRVAPSTYEPILLIHLLRHRLVQWQIEQALTGATNQIEIYSPQIEGLLLPVFPEANRQKLLAMIRRIEREISASRAVLRTQDAIINDAMCTEFGYPLKEHQERSRLHQFSASLSKMAAGFTLRNSSRYHHPDFDLTEEFFAKQKHEAVKAFVAVPIRLGSTAEKGDFVEAGSAYYVHPGATKRQEGISLDDCHQVSEDFYKARSRRFRLQRLDVTINRSGEAVGKVAYYDSDEPALFSDFTMRLRFNARMNPLFGWLYFRSVIFQAQLFREIMGASLPNVFPGQVERLLVVSCDRSRQDDLVKSIMADLKKQADAKQNINNKINEIQVAIESEVLAELQKL